MLKCSKESYLAIYLILSLFIMVLYLFYGRISYCDYDFSDNWSGFGGMCEGYVVYNKITLDCNSTLNANSSYIVFNEEKLGLTYYENCYYDKNSKDITDFVDLCHSLTNDTKPVISSKFYHNIILIKADFECSSSWSNCSKIGNTKINNCVINEKELLQIKNNTHLYAVVFYLILTVILCLSFYGIFTLLVNYIKNLTNELQTIRNK